MDNQSKKAAKRQGTAAVMRESLELKPAEMSHSA